MSVTVKSYVPKAIKLVNKGTNNGMIETVIGVTSQAKSLSPVAMVNGGLLRGSIQWKGKERSGGKTEGSDLTEKPKDLEYIVGTATDYGVYQEFGTRNMEAQPFLRPAVDIKASGMNAAAAMKKAMINSVRGLPTK